MGRGELARLRSKIKRSFYPLVTQKRERKASALSILCVLGQIRDEANLIPQDLGEAGWANVPFRLQDCAV